MSQTYEPNNPEQEQGHLAGPRFHGRSRRYPGGYSWAGYGSEPPPPPRRRNHKRGADRDRGGRTRRSAPPRVADRQLARADGEHGHRCLQDHADLQRDRQAGGSRPGRRRVHRGRSGRGLRRAPARADFRRHGLTNNHVIRGATSIKVTDVGNGRSYTAKVVGYDATKDVAVIQLQNASGLTTASLGDSSSVQNGDAVTALGNAGGKGGTRRSPRARSPRSTGAPSPRRTRGPAPTVSS